MGVKYRCNFQNFHLVDCSVEISSDLYDGEVIPVIAVQKEECTISPSGAEVPFDEPLRPTAARISWYSSNIDVDELQRANDRDWKITVRHDGIVKFVGFMIPDGLQRTRKGAGNVVIINGTCGLSLTKGITYTTPVDLGRVWHVQEISPGFGIQVWGHARNIINILRACLSFNPLPFRWHCNVKWEGRTEDDLLSGEVPFAGGLALAELAEFKDVDVNWIVENIVNSVKCFIVQDDGHWNIISWDSYYTDGDEYTVREIAAGMGDREVFTRTLGDITSDMSGKYINDSAYTMYSRSVGSVEVTYAQKQTANVVTNGSFDRTDGTFVEGWRYGVQSSRLVNRATSITGREGWAATLSTPIAEDYITTETPINIDGHVLYKDMTFGFTFSPFAGWPVDSNGVIQWGSRPFKISIEWILNNGTPYYLNEFGYWQDSARGIPLGVQATGVYRNNPILQTINNELWFSGSPNIGDVLVVAVPNSTTSNPTRVPYEFTVTELEEGNLQLALDRLLEAIPINIGSGQTTGSRSVVMQSPTSGRVQFRTNLIVRSSTQWTYKSTALQEYRFIYPTFEGLQQNDIVKFEFTSRGNSSGIKIPDPGMLDSTETLGGKLRIRFYVSGNINYFIDDVYISLDDNSDLYTTVVNDANSKLEYTLGISSAFSGFYISSFLGNPGNANTYMNYVDGSGDGTLTELYSRGVMQMRHDPKKLFSGDFMLSQGLSLLSLVRALGDDYIPMSYDWNLGTGQVVNFKGFEAEITDIEMNTTHKGSNDDNLLN